MVVPFSLSGRTPFQVQAVTRDLVYKAVRVIDKVLGSKLARILLNRDD
jgi:hypothetical protein